MNKNNIVVDTNVFISSALKSEGNPSKIMDLITSGRVQLYYSKEIFEEYKRVLAYKKLKISIESQNSLLKEIKKHGILVCPSPNISKNISFARDESDRIFYDTALSSQSMLITGNAKHYPNSSFIVTPAEYINARITINNQLL